MNENTNIVITSRGTGRIIEESRRVVESAIEGAKTYFRSNNEDDVAIVIESLYTGASTGVILSTEQVNKPSVSIALKAIEVVKESIKEDIPSITQWHKLIQLDIEANGVEACKYIYSPDEYERIERLYTGGMINNAILLLNICADISILWGKLRGVSTKAEDLEFFLKFRSLPFRLAKNILGDKKLTSDYAIGYHKDGGWVIDECMMLDDGGFIREIYSRATNEVRPQRHLLAFLDVKKSKDVTGVISDIVVKDIVKANMPAIKRLDASKVGVWVDKELLGYGVGTKISRSMAVEEILGRLDGKISEIVDHSRRNNLSEEELEEYLGGIDGGKYSIRRLFRGNPIAEFMNVVLADRDEVLDGVEPSSLLEGRLGTMEERRELWSKGGKISCQLRPLMALLYKEMVDEETYNLVNPIIYLCSTHTAGKAIGKDVLVNIVRMLYSNLFGKWKTSRTFSVLSGGHIGRAKYTGQELRLGDITEIWRDDFKRSFAAYGFINLAEAPYSSTGGVRGGLLIAKAQDEFKTYLGKDTIHYNEKYKIPCEMPIHCMIMATGNELVTQDILEQVDTGARRMALMYSGLENDFWNGGDGLRHQRIFNLGSEYDDAYNPVNKDRGLVEAFGESFLESLVVWGEVMNRAGKKVIVGCHKNIPLHNRDNYSKVIESGTGSKKVVLGGESRLDDVLGWLMIVKSEERLDKERVYETSCTDVVEDFLSTYFKGVISNGKVKYVINRSEIEKTFEILVDEGFLTRKSKMEESTGKIVELDKSVKGIDIELGEGLARVLMSLWIHWGMIEGGYYSLYRGNVRFEESDFRRYWAEKREEIFVPYEDMEKDIEDIEYTKFKMEVIKSVLGVRINDGESEEDFVKEMEKLSGIGGDNRISLKDILNSMGIINTRSNASRRNPLAKSMLVRSIFRYDEINNKVDRCKMLYI